MIIQERVEQGIEQEGSNLSGVSSRCMWEEPGDNDNHSTYSDEDKENNRSEAERKGSKDSDRRELSEIGKYDSTLVQCRLSYRCIFVCMFAAVQKKRMLKL